MSVAVLGTTSENVDWSTPGSGVFIFALVVEEQFAVVSGWKKYKHRSNSIISQLTTKKDWDNSVRNSRPLQQLKRQDTRHLFQSAGFNWTHREFLSTRPCLIVRFWTAELELCENNRAYLLSRTRVPDIDSPAVASPDSVVLGQYRTQKAQKEKFVTTEGSDSLSAYLITCSRQMKAVQEKLYTCWYRTHARDCLMPASRTLWWSTNVRWQPLTQTFRHPTVD